MFCLQPESSQNSLAFPSLSAHHPHHIIRLLYPASQIPTTSPSYEILPSAQNPDLFSSCLVLGTTKLSENCSSASWSLTSKPNGVKSQPVWAPGSPASRFGKLPGTFLPDDLCLLQRCYQFCLTWLQHPLSIFTFETLTFYHSAHHLLHLSSCTLSHHTIFFHILIPNPNKMPFSWTPENERTLLLVAISQGNVQPGAPLWNAMIQALGNGVTDRAVRYLQKLRLRPKSPRPVDFFLTSPSPPHLVFPHNLSPTHHISIFKFLLHCFLILFLHNAIHLDQRHRENAPPYEHGQASQF